MHRRCNLGRKTGFSCLPYGFWAIKRYTRKRIKKGRASPSNLDSDIISKPKGESGCWYAMVENIKEKSCEFRKFDDRRRKGRGGQRKKKEKKITRGEKERKLEVGREAVRWCRVASIESIRWFLRPGVSRCICRTTEYDDAMCFQLDYERGSGIGGASSRGAM